MDIFAFSVPDFMSFVLTFMRVSLIVFLLPFFGGDTIPTQVKAAVCLVLTIAIWPHHAISGSYFPAHPLGIAMLMGSELILGLGMGLMVNIIFAGLQTGGQIMGFQMGFSMITLSDPSSGQQLVITSFLAQTVALTLFLTMNGHLYLLHALVSSFDLVPPGQLLIGDDARDDMIKLSAQMFVLALKIAGPIMACLFMVEVTLGLMAKVSPQMNLMTIGFPIKIGVGLFFLSIVFSLIALKINEVISTLGPMFDNFMRTVGPGG